MNLSKFLPSSKLYLTNNSQANVKPVKLFQDKPYVWENEDGSYEGFMIDFLKELSMRMNFK